MNDREIFKSIHGKLSPGEEAQNRLFERAGQLRAGKKEKGDTDALQANIITAKEKKSGTAEVRDKRPVYAAIAAVIALAIGAGAVISITKGGGIESDKAPKASTQKKEDSKTDTVTEPSMTLIEEGDRPTDHYFALDMLRSAYKGLCDYGTFDGLKGSDGYRQLKNACTPAMIKMMMLDLYQNGELEGGLLEAAFYIAWECDEGSDRQKVIFIKGTSESYFEELQDSFRKSVPSAVSKEEIEAYIRLKLDRVSEEQAKSLSNESKSFELLLLLDGEVLKEGIYSQLSGENTLNKREQGAARNVLIAKFIDDTAEKTRLLNLPIGDYFTEFSEYYEKRYDNDLSEAE